jgi:hypothetical protein
MKTFRDYLAEAVKTYHARIKIAGDLPENFESALKQYMEKYEVIQFKKSASTPVQEHPHEFPRIKNKEVNIYDVETSYPLGYQQLESVLKDEFGFAGDHIRVKHPTDPTEIKPEEKEYETKLTDTEYKDAGETPNLYGDEYNMTMFKELMKTRKEDDTHQGEGEIVAHPEEKPKDVFHKGYDLKQSDGYSGSSITRHSK